MQTGTNEHARTHLSGIRTQTFDAFGTAAAAHIKTSIIYVSGANQRSELNLVMNEFVRREAVNDIIMETDSKLLGDKPAYNLRSLVCAVGNITYYIYR